MAESKPTSQITNNVSEAQKQPNPITSFLENLQHIFPLKLKQENKTNGAIVEDKKAKGSSEEGESYVRKPDMVKFKDTRPAVPPPLKLESEEASEQNPAVLWQIYAFGGFIVLKWLWARWNERRAKNQSSDEDSSNNPEDD